MSTDKFLHSALRTSCGALCQAIGWNATQSTALDVLSDVLQRYFMEIAKRTHSYAEHSGRSEPNLDDATLVLDDMHISIQELEEYIQNFDPVSFPVSIPAFPIERESHLNFLRPGSQEVLTRPVHVHEYMPPMIAEEEPKIKKDKPEDIHSSSGSSSVPEKAEVEAEVEKPTVTLNGRANGIDGDSKGMESEEEDSDNSQLPSSVISPHSPKTPKLKRLESPGENPALKRVRMMLEEEGHPLREITSVMMTTSGFLTSSREGRLPDTKPPPNRDFFEPIVTPVPERKKKIPTMKKIVEGVKKIDKEKENQNEKEKGESGFNLFEKPDKIFSSPSATTASASDKKHVDKEPAPEKVKESKESKSKEKKDKSEKKSEKKAKEEKSDKQKLKIFKKKLSKDAAKETPVKLKQIKAEAETTLEPIESDEDFGTTRSGSQSRETSPDKKSRKKDKLFATPKISDKKLKKKTLLGTSPGLKISHKASKVIEPVRIFENPDKIVPVLIGAQKKKRGRPKKSVSPFSLMGGLGLETPPAPPTSIKPVKFSRKMLAQEEMDMKSFVPEISINVKTPPPPGILHRLPLQPGLIPAFVPPSLKMPNPLPPSISITPATPTITPSSPAFKDARNSGQFGSLPSNVCSSVTITRIDMSNSQKLPTPFDSQPTPGIGSPNLSNKSTSSSAATIVPIQSDSGITITPIVMDKQSSQAEKPERPSMHSGLAKLEQNLITKEQRRKEKEKRKELKKEKKKERKEKSKEKQKKVEKSSEKERDKSVKKEKKDKSEKKRKKERDTGSSASLEATVPKLTLKLQHSTTTTPVDSPNPPQAFHGEPAEHPTPPPPLPPPPPPAPRKITIKPIEEVKQRTPSPELARFSPLVTRPSKKVPVPKKSPPAVIAKTPKQEVVAFPPVSSSGGANANANLKRGRGRPPKSTKTSSKSSTQAGLVTETVGSYIDEHGNKVWICPACGRQDDGSPMIGCEKCDDWYHFTCVGIVEAPDETESWFCKKCVVKEKASNFEYRKKVSRL
ncbi:unnamed protein product [Allacma fusca]|uniref:PHD-type domain-containing protein n=1 Tax=Allacma fusca TaxID=39272 RepID=A0A8J2LAU8_9HEXA|nr:unnamed protein product [Allacma fusca]